MKVKDIRVFIPSNNYEISKSFYLALGFKMEQASEQLTIFENGSCTFFLSSLNNESYARNLMLQLWVEDINEAFDVIEKLQNFDIKYQPIKQEPWGKVIYLTGPSGELLHVTEFDQ
ncbi:MAG: lactoylglutathione lyase [Thalassotalea sp.]